MRLIDADRIVYSWQIDADGQEHDGVTLQSIIDKMPTIEPEQQWIPCSERLPEDGRYLITGIRGTVYPLAYEDGRWYGGIRPVAWMPLPEAYSEPTCDGESCPIHYKEDEQ